VVDSPWKDEAKAARMGCNLIAPRVEAKLAGEDFPESPTRPTFAVQLIGKKRKAIKSEGPAGVED
jgi:hypothetical protein